MMQHQKMDNIGEKRKQIEADTDDDQNKRPRYTAGLVDADCKYYYRGEIEGKNVHRVERTSEEKQK